MTSSDTWKTKTNSMAKRRRRITHSGVQTKFLCPVNTRPEGTRQIVGQGVEGGFYGFTSSVPTDNHRSKRLCVVTA